MCRHTFIQTTWRRYVSQSLTQSWHQINYLLGRPSLLTHPKCKMLECLQGLLFGRFCPSQNKITNAPIALRTNTGGQSLLSLSEQKQHTHRLLLANRWSIATLIKTSKINPKCCHRPARLDLGTVYGGVVCYTGDVAKQVPALHYMIKSASSVQQPSHHDGLPIQF